MAKEIGQIVIMGGALTIPGNVSPFAEANISQDPEAAKLLFESGSPIIMAGLDVTMRSILTQKDTQKWRQISKVGEKYADIVDYYIHIHDETAPTVKGCPLHDPSAIAAIIHPELFDMLPLAMTVETEGPSVGRTIGITEKIREKTPNVKTCINVKKGAVAKDMCDTMAILYAGT
ncbi:inosine-uridine preferring nucleoside hydrolase [Tetragenococcus muriaticus 3MR10-3]|uniref:Inosine-uridine preferring nucleoside hydrolase n=2 Tax=Tetragenococcus muriaticus TaxID=64642 RepID=A0A091BV70_9ENTE|nr:inosine-uridine preferring nucleoside hydrolase [Tetragenococcus muriaticus 3MR10-3]